jgi:hypothetical protein
MTRPIEVGDVVEVVVDGAEWGMPIGARYIVSTVSPPEGICAQNPLCNADTLQLVGQLPCEGVVLGGRTWLGVGFCACCFVPIFPKLTEVEQTAEEPVDA